MGDKDIEKTQRNFGSTSSDQHYKKVELEKRINDKFKEVLGAYNSEKRPDESKYEDKNFNLELFAKNNGEWKQFCYKICRTQKLVSPNIFAFQNRVAKDQGKAEPVTVEIKQGEKEPNIVAFDDHLRL